MNRQSLAGWLIAATVCPQILMIGAAHASTSRITNIKTDLNGDRLQLMVNFASGDRPKVVFANQGKTWVANLSGVQLKLNNGNATFAQTNPAPGITSIEATQLGADKVQIRVTVAATMSTKDLVKYSNSPSGLIFSVATGESISSKPNLNKFAQAKPTQVSVSNPGKVTPLFQSKVTIIPSNDAPKLAQIPPASAGRPIPPSSTSVQPQLPGRVQGVVPPFQKRPVPPPVGDISVSSYNLRNDIIDLGSAERVSRLSLKEAPVREVLNLIARVAGLNVVFADDSAPAAGATPGAAPAAGASAGVNSRISVDIDNEPAQDVFNNILRLTGLDANRLGRTIFVGAKLPNSLRNVISRSYRLNQISGAEAANFLVGLGASRSVVRQRPVRIAETQAVGTITTITQAVPADEPALSVTTVSSPDGLLSGLQVVAEDRTNSVTLVGSPSKVELAAAQLARLDIRKRQVAVNVRIVDVNLNASQRTNANSSFGINDTFLNINDGIATVNFGENTPAAGPSVPGVNLTGRPVVTNPLSGSTLFTNPNGTQTVRDPVTGAFVPQTTNQPGSPFSESGSPLQPGISALTPAQQAAGATTGTAARYYLNPGGQINANLPGLAPQFKTGQYANTPLLLDPTTGTPVVATSAVAALPSTIGQAAQYAYSLPGLFQYPKQFLTQLQFQIQTGNAKILTDPTLTVQEGESAVVSLVQEVSRGIVQEFQNINGQTLSTSRVNIGQAGLTLNVKVDRIDDNGFINMSVAPTVSVPGQTIQVNQGAGFNPVTLLITRALTSGQIRLRDNQTLILSGVIQDTDVESVQKVPFLGDLPLIGQLFRRTTTENTRREVIIIVTPRIIDDSERSQFGYTYQPGPEVQKLIDNNNTPFR
jgi:type IV pilus assembly protein PilQ